MGIRTFNSLPAKPLIIRAKPNFSRRVRIVGPGLGVYVHYGLRSRPCLGDGQCTCQQTGQEKRAVFYYDAEEVSTEYDHRFEKTVWRLKRGILELPAALQKLPIERNLIATKNVLEIRLAENFHVNHKIKNEPTITESPKPCDIRLKLAILWEVSPSIFAAPEDQPGELLDYGDLGDGEGA